MHDVRLAVRSARRSPGISLACALTLALGAGATTSALALLNGVVLKPLPVDRPRELVLFSDDTRDGVVFTGTPQGTLILFSTPSFEYLHAHQQTFTGVAAFQVGRDRVASRIDAATELAAVTRVSASYFSVLGVRAQAGRLFDTNDDRGGALPAVVMSDACWLRRFQRDPAVIGRSVTLGATSYTIAGVAARGFYGESLREPPDFWMPFAPNAATPPGAYDEHHTWWLGLIGRLKPGVTIAQASADVNARLQEFLIDEAGSALSPERRDEIAHTTIALARGDLGRSSIRIRAIAPLTLLVVLVVLLLVAASTNVATLLVARATARDRVTTIHLMLGASRARVVRLALAETLAIAGPGLAAGIAVALTSPRLLLPLVTTAPLPIDVVPDARLIAMIAAAAAVAVVVACAGPVWRVLTADGRQMGRPLHLDSPSSHHLGRALVIVQMALAAPLLIVAGLLIRSVDRLEGQDLAVNRGHVLLVDFGPSLAASPERTATAVRRDLLDRVREQPYVADATFASQTPLGGGVHGSSLRVEGRPPREDRDAVAAFVGPGYFHTLAIPLVTGRDFSAQDDAAHPPVVVLSETAARVFGAGALGQRVAYGTRPFAEVIGIAKDVKFTSLREAAPRQVYLAQLQNGALGGRLVVRTDSDPLAVAASLRDVIRRAAPNLPITKMTTLDEEILAKTATERALAMTATGLASATLLVSAIGLCGLTAYMVARRTREFGIRMALGASQGHVMRAVVASALRLVGAGSIVGAIAAVATTRVVASLLYDVSPADGVVLAASIAALLVAALAASLVPAAQASRVDPVTALRTE